MLNLVYIQAIEKRIKRNLNCTFLACHIFENKTKYEQILQRRLPLEHLLIITMLQSGLWPRFLYTLCCVLYFFYMSGGNYRLKSTPNDAIFEKLFMVKKTFSKKHSRKSFSYQGKKENGQCNWVCLFFSAYLNKIFVFLYCPSA